MRPSCQVGVVVDQPVPPCELLAHARSLGCCVPTVGLGVTMLVSAVAVSIGGVLAVPDPGEESRALFVRFSDEKKGFDKGDGAFSYNSTLGYRSLRRSS